MLPCSTPADLLKLTFIPFPGIPFCIAGTARGLALSKGLAACQLSPKMHAPALVICAVCMQMGSMTDNTSGGTYPYRASKAAMNAGNANASLACVMACFSLSIL